MTTTWFPQGAVESNPADEPHATIAIGNSPAICDTLCTAGCDTTCTPFGTMPVPQDHEYEWVNPAHPSRIIATSDPYAGDWS